MRTILVFAVLAVVLAGCTSNNGGTPTTPTAGGNSTTPGSAMTPKVIKSGTVTWPTDCSTPGSAGAPTGACAPIAVTVDAGYATLNFTVTWSCNTTPACTSNGASIAAGGLTCDAPASIDPVQNPSPAPCVKTGPATAGPAKITPSGDANMVATYKLTEQ